MNKKRLLITMVVAGFTAAAYAGDQNGTATAVFLRMEQGARAQGMGGAFAAVSGDVEGAWWNPATPVSLNAAQIHASYSDLIDDVAASYAAIAIPAGNGGRNSFLASANYITMGDVDARDAAGVAISKISPTDLVLSAGYAIQIGPALSLGVMAKSVQQNLGEDKSSGIAVDAGLLMRMTSRLSLGFALQNMGSNQKIGTVENKLPLNIRGGLGYMLSKKVLACADYEKPNDADARLHAGAEYSMTDTFILRAGYNTSSAVGFTAGVGIITPVAFGTDGDSWWKDSMSRDLSHRVVRVDYAYVSNGNFDATHRLSLTIKL